MVDDVVAITTVRGAFLGSAPRAGTIGGIGRQSPRDGRPVGCPDGVQRLAAVASGPFPGFDPARRSATGCRRVSRVPIVAAAMSGVTGPPPIPPPYGGTLGPAAGSRGVLLCRDQQGTDERLEPGREQNEAAKTPVQKLGPPDFGGRVGRARKTRHEK